MKKVIGFIVLGIFLAANSYAEPGADRPKRPDPQELAAKLIADFDHDGSGTLDEVELAEALVFMKENRPRPPRHEGMRPRREPPAPEEVAQRMLEKHDADGDTLLSEEELVQALASRPGPHGRRGGPRPDEE